MSELRNLFAGSREAAWAKLPQWWKDRIDRDSSPRGCWLWTGKKAGSGQAMAFMGDGKSAIAYREVYRIVNGVLPRILRHSCDNKICVNPAHLMPGSLRSNNTDAARRGRIKRKLSDREVQEIRYMIDRGDRMVDIAPRYGVSPEMVGQIKNRKRYHWLAWSPRRPQ